LACDFDGPGWVLDALSYLDAAHAGGIPAALERSRSGDGGHVWVFFEGPVAAAAARRIGVHLLREAMTVRAELDLVSYDRLFPAQDFMPKGSFGNLIALPLQGRCRKRGTTVFLDPADLKPYEDQWAFLSSLQRLAPQAAQELADGLGQLAAGPDAATFRRATERSAAPAPPARVVARAGAMLVVDRIGMPPAMLAALKHLASLHNPDFYEKEKLRFSTWNTPGLPSGSLTNPWQRRRGGAAGAGQAAPRSVNTSRLTGLRLRALGGPEHQRPTCSAYSESRFAGRR
jgi:hypothetical protein